MNFNVRRIWERVPCVLDVREYAVRLLKAPASGGTSVRGHDKPRLQRKWLQSQKSFHLPEQGKTTGWESAEGLHLRDFSRARCNPNIYPQLRELQIQDRRQRWRWVTRTVPVFPIKPTQPFSAPGTSFSQYQASTKDGFSHRCCCSDTLSKAWPGKQVTRAHSSASLMHKRTLGFVPDIVAWLSAADIRITAVPKEWEQELPALLQA